MKKIEYVAVCDGTFTYKVDTENKTYKLVMDDCDIIEPFEKRTIISEAFSISAFLEEENLKGFKEVE